MQWPLEASPPEAVRGNSSLEGGKESFFEAYTVSDQSKRSPLRKKGNAGSCCGQVRKFKVAWLLSK